MNIRCKNLKLGFLNIQSQNNISHLNRILQFSKCKNRCQSCPKYFFNKTLPSQMPLYKVPKFPQLITSNASYLVYKNEWVQCLVVWMSCKCEGNDRVPVTDPTASLVL